MNRDKHYAGFLSEFLAWMNKNLDKFTEEVEELNEEDPSTLQGTVLTDYSIILIWLFVREIDTVIRLDEHKYHCF